MFIEKKTNIIGVVVLDVLCKYTRFRVCFSVSEVNALNRPYERRKHVVTIIVVCCSAIDEEERSRIKLSLCLQLSQFWLKRSIPENRCPIVLLRMRRPSS